MRRYMVTLHAPVFLIYMLVKIYELLLRISLPNWLDKILQFIRILLKFEVEVEFY
jgi:hypothetical protein